MPNYTEFMMRHSEFGIQAIIEQIERVEGLRSHVEAPLEDRWAALMQNPSNNNEMQGDASCSM